jgi:hypothetical protein
VGLGKTRTLFGHESPVLVVVCKRLTGQIERTPIYYPDSAWQVGFIGGYKFQVEAGVLDLSSYDRFFYATGVTPASPGRGGK